MKKCLLALIFLILISTSALGLTATTLTGMIQINVDKVPITVQKSLGVRNENNETVRVEFIPETDIASMVSMESYNISLAPGEERFVKFNVTITELKKTVSSINLVFSGPSPADNATEEKFGIATKLVIMPANESVSNDINITIKQPVHVTDSSSNATSEGNSTGETKPAMPGFQYIVVAIAGLLIAVLVAIIILKTKAGAKNE
jgi:hypothetical protein